MSSITVFVDGDAVTVPAGATVAVALLQSAPPRGRTSVTGESRAPLCGMGTCYECRVTLDGVPHLRSCLVVARDGMRVSTSAQAQTRTNGSTS